MQTYDLTFSFTATLNSTITVALKDKAGTNQGSATIVSSFADGIWYAYTLTIVSGFQGFVSFSDGVSTVAQFAINPSETETLPTQGVGGEIYTVTVKSNTNIPIEAAAVWVTLDQEGKQLKGGTLYSNDVGKATFVLSPGNYYVWRRHPNWNFDNPILITVPNG